MCAWPMLERWGKRGGQGKWGKWGKREQGAKRGQTISGAGKKKGGRGREEVGDAEVGDAEVGSIGGKSGDGELEGGARSDEL